eukprot:6939954-Pyramimonas_sp.AAC.1
MASRLQPGDHPARRNDEPRHDRIRCLDLAPQCALQLQRAGLQQTCCKLVGALGADSTLPGKRRISPRQGGATPAISNCARQGHRGRPLVCLKHNCRVTPDLQHGQQEGHIAAIKFFSGMQRRL